MKEQEDTRILLCCSMLVVYQYAAVDLKSKREKNGSKNIVEKNSNKETRLHRLSKGCFPKTRGFYLVSPGLAVKARPVRLGINLAAPVKGYSLWLNNSGLICHV